MADSVVLRMAGLELANWSSYEISHDMFLGAGSFRFELGPRQQVESFPPASPCQVYVNGCLELTGLIDKPCARYDKRGKSRTIQGRDLMGLLVDSHIEPPFFSVRGMKLSALAARLLKDIPWINRKPVIGEDVTGSLRRHKRGTQSALELFDRPQAITQIQPGMTVFQVLREYAMSRGLMFWCAPDGTFVFGKPKNGGEPSFSLTHRLGGVGNNVMEGEYEQDWSRRFSRITVIGCQQGQDHMEMDATRVYTYGHAEDNEFPFRKPFVAKNNNDYQSPALHARLLKERMRHEGTRLTYKVARHSQNGANWTFNEMCHVRDEDEDFNLDGLYLIYGRTFRMDKREGQTTTLRLGPPGVMA